MKTIKTTFILAIIFVVCFLIISCNSNNQQVNDYSKYPFTDVSWTRQAEHDIETIRFGSDKSFAYSCSCGNPVNDADLCDSYSYDDTTKTITLHYFETTDETITKITIERFDNNSLSLNFNGEIRTFVRQLEQ